ncbi:MAG: hypothetical protein H0T76_26155 [Nannocystis sp.]|nr:hypothetical protein [Nannocystis sp.]MBA3549977.1 hypothetical protein [Nannocystis sp.]
MRYLGIISIAFGVLALGIYGVFALWIVDRHEQAVAQTEDAQRHSSDPMGNGVPALLESQRDKRDKAVNIRLVSGVASAILIVGGIGLMTRRRRLTAPR